MGKILSINVSEVRGVEKNSIPEVEIIEGYGLAKDAHGGNWDRQVSIFPLEGLEKVPHNKVAMVMKGGYTENLTIIGIPLEELKVGAIVKVGEAEVKINYVGKDEYKEYDRPYIVSREGRFCEVVKGGTVKLGDKVEILK